MIESLYEKEREKESEHVQRKWYKMKRDRAIPFPRDVYRKKLDDQDKNTEHHRATRLCFYSFQSVGVKFGTRCVDFYVRMRQAPFSSHNATNMNNPRRHVHCIVMYVVYSP